MSSSNKKKKVLTKPSLEITNFFKSPSILISTKNNKNNKDKNLIKRNKSITPVPLNLSTNTTTNNNKNKLEEIKKGKRKAEVIEIVDSSDEDSDLEIYKPTSRSKPIESTSVNQDLTLPSIDENEDEIPEVLMEVEVTKEEEIEIDVPEVKEEEEIVSNQDNDSSIIIDEAIEEEEHNRITTVAAEIQQLAKEIEEAEGEEVVEELNYGSDWGDDENERVFDCDEEEGGEWNGEEEEAYPDSEQPELELDEVEDEEESQVVIVKNEIIEIEDEDDDESDDDDCMIIQGSSKDLDALPHSCPLCDKNLSNLSEQERQLHVNVCLDGGTSSGFAPRSSLFRTKFDSPVASTSKLATATSSTLSSSKSKTFTPIIKSETPTERKPSTSWLPTSFSTSTSSSTTNTKLKPKIKSTSTSTLAQMPNAFTAIMAGHSEDKLWKAAEISDKKRGRLPAGEKRSVPFYKKLEGMSEITVDAFKYGKIEGCKAYFLSHAHSDHYQNLSASWSGGPVYCSQTTRNLIKLKLKVKDEYLKVLPMNETVQVPGTKATVTLIDANHCPGSTIFLFSGPHTDASSYYTKTPSRIFHILHCGDFRASPAHLLHPVMKGKKIDVCYLDTTYLNPRYCFPAQELVVEACSELVRMRIEEGERVEGLLESGGIEDGSGVGEGREMMKGWLGKGKEKEVIKGEEDGEDEDWNGGEIDKNDDDKPISTSTSIKEIESGKFDSKGVKIHEKEVVKIENGKKFLIKKREKMLVLVGTYSIGKERIVKGIAKALNTKVYCDDHKLALLKAQDDPILHALITRDPMAAQVHIVALRDINQEAMSTYLAKYHKQVDGFTKVIGLRPTGWTHKAEAGAELIPTISSVLSRESTRRLSAAKMYPQRDSTPTIMGYGVPYSEHSSFFELTAFALSMDYVKMIATVNIQSAASRGKMAAWYEKWKVEKKRRADAGIPRMVPARNINYW